MSEPLNFNFEGMTVTATVKGDCGCIHTVEEWQACAECAPSFRKAQRVLEALIEREWENLGASCALAHPNTATRLYQAPDGSFRSEAVDLYAPRCSCSVVHTCGFVCA